MSKDLLRTLIRLFSKYEAKLSLEQGTQLAGDIEQKTDEEQERTRREYAMVVRIQKGLQDGSLTQAEFNALMKDCFLEDTIRTMKS